MATGLVPLAAVTAANAFNMPAPHTALVQLQAPEPWLAVQVLLLGVKKAEVVERIWLLSWAGVNAGLMARIKPAVAATRGEAKDGQG